MGAKRRSHEDDWIKTRRNILRNAKAQVEKIVGVSDPHIRKYGLEFENEFKTKWSVSSKEELLRSILKSRVVLGGDFHAHAQSQRTHLRILRSLPAGVRVILALEAFESQHQAILDKFMKGSLSEKVFLEKIDWERRWGFSWNHYKPLLDLARERGFTVVALNRYFSRPTAKSLYLRDSHAAKIVKALISQFQDGLVYAIYGDLHLAKSHLPLLISQGPGPLLKPLVIHQNSERVYFQLARQRQEMQTDVVRFANGNFCVMNSPPWLRWQSYLMHLEGHLAWDIDELGDERYSDAVIHVIRQVAAELRMKVDLSDLSIFASGELDVRRRFVFLKSSQKKIAQDLVSRQESFFEPKSSILYLAKLEINSAGAMAGQYLAAKQGAYNRLLWDMPHDFTGLVWIEAVSFFVSKLINPARRFDTLTDLSRMVSREKNESADVLKLCLSFKRNELAGTIKPNGKTLLYQPRHWSSYLRAAKSLGALLGEQMFWGYRNGTIRRTVVKKWLSENVHGQDFSRFYLREVRRLNSTPSVVKTKEERL